MEKVAQDIMAGELKPNDRINFPWNGETIIEVFHNDPQEDDFMMAGDPDSLTIFQLPKTLLVRVRDDSIEVGKLREGDKFKLIWNGGICEVLTNDGGDEDVLVLDDEYGDIGVIIEKSVFVQKVESDEDN